MRNQDVVGRRDTNQSPIFIFITKENSSSLYKTIADKNIDLNAIKFMFGSNSATFIEYKYSGKKPNILTNLYSFVTGINYLVVFSVIPVLLIKYLTYKNILVIILDLIGIYILIQTIETESKEKNSILNKVCNSNNYLAGKIFKIDCKKVTGYKIFNIIDLQELGLSYFLALYFAITFILPFNEHLIKPFSTYFIFIGLIGILFSWGTQIFLNKVCPFCLITSFIILAILVFMWNSIDISVESIFIYMSIFILSIVSVKSIIAYFTYKEKYLSAISLLNSFKYDVEVFKHYLERPIQEKIKYPKKAVYSFKMENNKNRLGIIVDFTCENCLNTLNELKQYGLQLKFYSFEIWLSTSSKSNKFPTVQFINYLSNKDFELTFDQFVDDINLWNNDLKNKNNEIIFNNYIDITEYLFEGISKVPTFIINDRIMPQVYSVPEILNYLVKINI